MAIESPIRLLEANNKGPSRSRSGSPPSAKRGIENLCLFQNSQMLQSLEKDVISIPSQSGSAPPSIGLLSPCASTGDSEPVSHPAFFSHLGSIANLDGRANGDSKSSKNSQLFHFSGSTGNDGKLTPHAENADDSLRLHRSILPSHDEELEDDRSSERNGPASVDKATKFSDDGGSSDSTQQNFLMVPSPSHYWSTKSGEEGIISDADSHALLDLSVSTSTVVTNNPAPISDNLSQVLKNDPRTTSIQSLLLDGGVKAPSALSSDHKKFHKIDQVNPQNCSLPQQAALQEGNTSPVPDSYSQLIHPGNSRAYGSFNQFHHGSSNISKAEVQPVLQTSGFTPPFDASAASFTTSQNPCYLNLQPAGFFTQQFGMAVYPFHSIVFPSYLAGCPPQGVVPMSVGNVSFPTSGAAHEWILHAYGMQNVQYYDQAGISMQPPPPDPYHMLDSKLNVHYQFDHQEGKYNAVASQANDPDMEKEASVAGFKIDQESQHSTGAGYKNLNFGRGNASNHYSMGRPTNISNIMQIPSPSFVTPVGPARPVEGTNFLVERINTGHPHSLHGNGKPYGLQNPNRRENDSYCFLEKLKSGEGDRFELSDIVGHIGDFSFDQHGSRFIQQKLENSSVEEKASVFKEVIPQASKLMNDAFGNYVIQKLFDYSGPDQKKDLANQLKSKVLELSLQMYGCRVIQKAIEVIDLEQKVQLARELDGHVLRCIHDRNGNHVIQKCIEGIPADNIEFIISSFRGQVATLSMHPYGYRVIQSVLEKYTVDLQSRFIVDEILDSVYSLAQDQYGNYVTQFLKCSDSDSFPKRMISGTTSTSSQHVLKLGIPCGRTEIIEKLSGSILQLSQHKFASNVVEKCLEYGDDAARNMLIKEIIGNGDRNDNILMMMKDQYANYVIQKILPICTCDQRKLLLCIIRNNLTALREFTYGKHIVAKLERYMEKKFKNLDCESTQAAAVLAMTLKCY